MNQNQTPGPATAPLDPPTLTDTILAGEALLIPQARDRLIENEKVDGPPPAHPRASSIGDCTRELYYQITEGALRPAFKAKTLHRFRRGSMIHTAVAREIEALGYRITHQEVAFREEVQVNGHKQVIVAGHIDGRVEILPGQSVIYETKSLHPNVWERIDGLGDFLEMGSFWTKFPRQILLYLLGHNEERGLMFLDNCLGALKVIPIFLNEWLAVAEEAMTRCEEAVRCRLAGTAPDFCNKPRVCMECWCREAGVCQPPLAERDVNLVDDETLALALDRIAELEEAGKEYKRLEDKAKRAMKPWADGRYLCGDHIVTVERKVRKAYDVPDEVKRQYLREADSVYVSWQSLKGKQVDVTG